MDALEASGRVRPWSRADLELLVAELLHASHEDVERRLSALERGSWSSGGSDSLRCYGRLGFEEKGRFDGALFIDGAYQDLVWMGVSAGA